MSKETAGNVVYNEILGNKNYNFTKEDIKVLIFDTCFELFENQYDDTRLSNGCDIDAILLLLDKAILKKDINKFKSILLDTAEYMKKLNEVEYNN